MGAMSLVSCACFATSLCAQAALGDVMAAAGLFTGAQVQVPVPFTSGGLAKWADLDGDGDLDMLVGTSAFPTGSIVSVYWSNGAGGFAQDQARTFVVEASPLVPGDLDGDGDADFISVQVSPTTRLVRRMNLGGGVLGPKIVIPDLLEYGYPLLGDMDGDGDLDLVAIGKVVSSQREIHILSNDGSGAFANPVRYTTRASASSGGAVALLDVDTDGHLDLVMLASSDLAILVHRNDGAGGVLPEIVSALPATPTSLVVADHGGGPPNLFIGSAVGTFVLQSNGLGGFHAAVPVDFGITPTRFRAADLDGDGDVDLVGASAQGELSIVHCNGAGVFAPPVRGFGAMSPFEIGILDIDGDGMRDLCVVEKTLMFVTLFSNRGSGDFEFRQPTTIDSTPSAMVSADFDGNGTRDIAIAMHPTGQVRIMLNGGDADLSPGPLIDVGILPIGIATGDLNADGHADIVVTNDGSYTASVILGNGDGTFQPRVDIACGANPQGVDLGDVDGDGDLDIVIANVSIASVTVLRNNGNGTFAPRVTTPVTGMNFETVRLGDLDNDGDLDLAVTHLSAHHVSVLSNDGTGAFAVLTSFSIYVPSQGPGPSMIAIGDIDSDGIVDLVIGCNNGAPRTVRNNGDGTFGPHVPQSNFGVVSRSLELADINGDGNLDAIVGVVVGFRVGVALGNGAGQFSSVTLFSSVASAVSTCVGDFTGDGRLDIVSASALEGKLVILRNAATSPAPTCTGDINGDGFTNAADFTILAGNFGSSVTPNTSGDLNGDGIVNAADFVILAGDFGSVCP